jgi:hypothetical protein
MAGLTLSLFISITKIIFCFLMPGLPPHSEARDSPCKRDRYCLWCGCVFYRPFELKSRGGLPLSLGLSWFSPGSQLK